MHGSVILAGRTRGVRSRWIASRLFPKAPLVRVDWPRDYFPFDCVFSDGGGAGVGPLRDEAPKGRRASGQGAILPEDDCLVVDRRSCGGGGGGAGESFYDSGSGWGGGKGRSRGWASSVSGRAGW